MAKNSTKAVLDNFKIQSYVDSLFESNMTNSRLVHFLSEYRKVLEAGDAKEFMLYEEFGHGLANFATGNKAVKKVINEMNGNLATYGKELNTYKLMECICDDSAKCACENAYTNYLENQDAKSKAILVNAVDVLAQSGDPVAPQLTIVVANPEAQLEPQQIQTFDGASKFDEIQRKIEEDKLRQSVEAAKAEIDAYAEKKYAEMKAAEEAERNANVYDNVVNNNGICLGESIKAIMNSEAKSNKKLVETLEQYSGALNQGLYEERLYEGFIKNLTPFNYLKSVDKEIKRLEKVAEDHQVSINVTKILEEMYLTDSYYILPLIQEDACRFIKNPTDVNCNQLKAALVTFAADPYCRAIMEELEYFNNKPSFLLNDATMTIKDRAKLIKEHANISNIYSPVQYVKENECVFNANGQFYVKKGNTLAKLSEEYVPELKEDFITLCQLVNDPRVVINEDHITLLGNNKIANIYESYIDINGNKESIESVRDLGGMQLKYDFDNNFFIMTSCLAENFNKIANINFGKHVALNEDEGIHVDLFNLNGNIFVNAVNEAMLANTFYHNVNPIQCRNLINRHMGINVASLFEDLLPAQEKFYLKLNETKEEYEASIAKYEATIAKLKEAKEKDISEDSEKKLDAAIEAAQAKVDELKKEYKDWQDDVDKVTKPDSKVDKGDSEDNDETDDNNADNADDNNANDNTEVEKSNEPIDPDEVEAAKADLSAPLSSEGSDLSVSDDEFDSYLETGSEIPDNADEMDPTDVNMVHHALDGDGTENQEPNPDELDDPMNTNDEDPFAEFNDEENPANSEENPEENPEETSSEDPFKEVDSENPEDTPEPEVTPEEPVSDEPLDSEGEEPINFEDHDEEVESPVEDEHSGEKIGQGAPEEVEGVALPEGYKIANIKFDENLKTGEIFRTGNITVLTDMVKSDGTLYTDSATYQFYIDEETHLPIIEAADIPVALYNAMVSSIQSDGKFNQADMDGVSTHAETTTTEGDEEEGLAGKAPEPSFDSDEKDFPDYDDVYYDAKEVQDASDELEKDDEEGYFDFKDEPDGSLTISAKEEPSAPEHDEEIIKAETEDEPVPSVKASDLFKNVEDEPEENGGEDVVIPTYKEGNTEIEMPAKKIGYDNDEDDFDFSELDDEDNEKPSTEDVDESLMENNVPAQQPQQLQAQLQPAQQAAPAQQAQPTQQAPAQPAQVQLQPAQQAAPAQPAQQLQQAPAQPTQQLQPAQLQQAQPQQKNESVKSNAKLSLNEARAALVKLQAEYKTSDNKQSFIVEGASKPSKKEAESLNEGGDWTELATKVAKDVGEKVIQEVLPKLTDAVAKKASEAINNAVDKKMNNNQHQNLNQNAQAQPAQLQQAQPAQLQQAQQLQATSESLNEEDDKKDDSTAKSVVSTGVSAAGSALGVGELTDEEAQELIKELFTNEEYRELLKNLIINTASLLPGPQQPIINAVTAIMNKVKAGEKGTESKSFFDLVKSLATEKTKMIFQNMKMLLECLKNVFIGNPKYLLDAAKIFGGFNVDTAAAGGEGLTAGIATVVLAPIQAGATQMMVKSIINIAAALIKEIAKYVKEHPDMAALQSPNGLQNNNLNNNQQLNNQNQQNNNGQQLNNQLNQNNNNQQKNESVAIDAIDKLYEYAIENAGNKVEITKVQSAKNESVKFFGIIDLLRQKEPMAVYEIGDKVFYSNYDDLIYSLNESSVTVDDLQAFDDDDTDYVNTALLEDGYLLIDTLLLERAKIRKPGLSSKGDINKSQKMAEILNGTKDRQEFEERVERETQQAGVENPLLQAAQPQQESVNVEEDNDLSESLVNKENVEIIYEPMDWVVIKENGMKAQVVNVVNDGDGKLAMLTILASNGVTYDADPDEIEPDPLYLANLPGRTINSTLLGVPRLAEFDINPQTRLTDKVNNDDPALEQKYKNFND